METDDLKNLYLSGALKGKRLYQILTFAGEGKLLDGSMSSEQFRAYLQVIPRKLLSEHIDECLAGGFENSPQALQDLVNEISRRLGFDVQHGLYRGKKGVPGHDGLWLGSHNIKFIIEVKTTDTYMFDLERLGSYRDMLIEAKEVEIDKSYILILVGNQKTGGIEAQIRGSRQAWHTRIISIYAFLKLLELREMLDNLDTERLTQFLKPVEFTRLDNLLNLLFWSAEEAKEPRPEEIDDSDLRDPGSVRDAVLSLIEKKTGLTVIKRTRTTAEIPLNNIGLFFSYSKTYKKGNSIYFWYKFTPNHNAFLRSKSKAYLVFICDSPDEVIIIPYNKFVNWITILHTTPPEPDPGDTFYWHIQIIPQKDKLLLFSKPDTQRPNLSLYKNSYKVIQ